jgi:serine/threonine-protein kinase
LSADSKRLLLIVEAGTQEDVWVYETERDAMTRLTFGGVMHSSPIWSPNGRYVVFGRRGQGIFWTRSDGGGQPQELIKSSGAIQLPASFSADGKWLAYTQGTGTGPDGTHIWVVPVREDGGQLRAESPEPFHHTPFAEGSPAFSPDGRWLAYESTESGRSEIDVRPFHLGGSSGGGKWRISSEGGSAPIWSHNGRDLLYRNGDRIMAVRYTTDGSSFVAERARVWLTKLDGAAAGGWDLSHDDTRLAVIATEPGQAPKQNHTVVLFLDFFDDLLRRVPLTR